MKDFAVIGLGNFGANVARELTKLECKVTAIDVDKTRMEALRDDVEVAILSDATDRAVLENLDVPHFDCFVVSTGKDSHASILITLHLHELGAQRIVVKANSADHARILAKVGATKALIPEKQMATQLSRTLAQPNLVDFLPLTGDYSVAELVPPKKFIGAQLADLRIRTEYRVQVIAVKDSDSDEYRFAPGGDCRIKAADILVVLGKDVDIDKLRE